MCLCVYMYMSVFQKGFEKALLKQMTGTKNHSEFLAKLLMNPVMGLEGNRHYGR